MPILSVEPNSAAWLKCREGRITASRLKDVIDYLKDGKTPTAKRKGYLMEVVAERLTSIATDHYVSPAMEWGIEYEPMARMAYEAAMDVMVDRIGFATHPSLDYTGASPDALVGEDGGLEIKCPLTTTHLNWKLAGEVPDEHFPQMMWNMVCCDRKWWDFLSFDPRLPEGLRTFCVRLEYNQASVDYYTSEVVKFNAEVQQMIARLRGAE